MSFIFASKIRVPYVRLWITKDTIFLRVSDVFYSKEIRRKFAKTPIRFRIHYPQGFPLSQR